jgi:hypothetical protein
MPLDAICARKSKRATPAWYRGASEARRAKKKEKRTLPLAYFTPPLVQLLVLDGELA